MPERIQIIEETIRVDDFGLFPTRMWLQIPDSGQGFSVFVKIFDETGKYGRDGVLCNFRVRFIVRNPIDGGIFIAIGSKYGLCVAWKFGRYTIEKAIDDYKTWNDAFPGEPIPERVKAVAQKFGHDSKQFREEIGKTLKSCLTLGLWPFGRGGDGPDDNTPDV